MRVNWRRFVLFFGVVGAACAFWFAVGYQAGAGA